MSYTQAKEFINSQSKVTQFQGWSQSNRRLANFPSDPSQVYEKDWQGWVKLLGRTEIEEAEQLLSSGLTLKPLGRS
ncbi:MAG: hypothetical protein OXN83_02660 [Oligoflexia bacterium]|nr:hypothetical protein [Oligoflexia bacterium]